MTKIKGNIMQRARAAMIRGGMSMQEINLFIERLNQGTIDNRVEVMMLMSARVLKRDCKWGRFRIRRHLKAIDDMMLDFAKDDFDLDKLRVQVFEETGFVFAANERDEEHIQMVLKAAGYEVEIAPKEQE